MSEPSPLSEMMSMARSLARIAKNTDPAAYHVPALYPSTPGEYPVICYACSRDAERPVAVCQLPPEERDYAPEWPPAILYPDVNSLAVHQLEQVRRYAAGVLMDTPAGDPRQFVVQQIIDILKGDDTSG